MKISRNSMRVTKTGVDGLYDIYEIEHKSEKILAYCNPKASFWLVEDNRNGNVMLSQVVSEDWHIISPWKTCIMKINDHGVPVFSEK